MTTSGPRILHVSTTDSLGGAALAARRLVAAQCRAGMDARMLVLEKQGDDDFVERLENRAPYRRMRAARLMVKHYTSHFAHDYPELLRTLAVLRTGLGAEVARHKPDIVQWHWVGAETIGLADLLDTRHIPSIWTCRDHWIACGAEHFALSGGNADGYRSRKPWDPDRWTFGRKKRLMRQWRPQLVSLSEACIPVLRQSELVHGLEIEAIPNVVDFASLFPAERAQARRKLGLAEDRNILLFGAQGGRVDTRKGFAYLQHALDQLPQELKDSTQLVTFGGKQPSRHRMHGMDVVELGHLSPGEQLRTAFSAASVFANPSLAEAFGNTNVEALACGTPCVAFATGTAIDMMTTPAMGKLVPVGDRDGFAVALKAQLETVDSEAERQMRHDHVAQLFAEERVIAAYRKLYARMMEKGANHG